VNAHRDTARSAAVLALGLVLAAVAAVLLFPGGSGYQIRLLFSDASGLVDGDQVLIGPAQVGTVRSVSLTRSGQAAILIRLGGAAAPLRAGSSARIEENGLAGIASHYVTIQPGPRTNLTLNSGATIAASHNHAEVSLDELFDAFNPATRAGLRQTIDGEATAISGRSAQANATLAYLDPALASTSALTAELTHYEGSFDQLLVNGSATLQALATRAGQLTQLISSTASATGAIADQSGALDRTLVVLPHVLTHSTGTLSTLSHTLEVLTPVVKVAKPAVTRLPQFTAALDTLAQVARPAVTQLVALVPEATGLLTQTPRLEAVAARAFPDGVGAMNASQTQINALLAYTPDVVAALSSLGQASAYYDANGHYTRTQPFFNAFSLNPADQLTLRAPADRLEGLTHVTNRCPGSAVPASPDGSAPYVVAGCDGTETP
jgi:phospholipid/cholesterol/gamma-HCH transport system substrate-binding protein